MILKRKKQVYSCSEPKCELTVFYSVQSSLKSDSLWVTLKFNFLNYNFLFWWLFQNKINYDSMNIQRMRLQRRLYRINIVCFIKCMRPRTATVNFILSLVNHKIIQWNIIFKGEDLVQPWNWLISRFSSRLYRLILRW